MRKALTVAMLGAAVAAIVLIQLRVGGASDDNGAKAEVTKLIQDWDQALAGRDTTGLAAMLSDDFRITFAGGLVRTKPQYLMAIIKSPSMTLETATQTDELEVRAYGNAAVATGRTTGKAPFRGPASAGQYRFTDVFIKRDGRWQAVATHLTISSEAVR